MADKARPKCGMIRPISPREGYPAQHWLNVEALVREVAARVSYDLRLVSDNDAPGVFMAHVMQHLADDPIVVCDVSSLNPNVMFELGLRIAFQKPVVIIKDDRTEFAGDIRGIQHLTYPQTLHVFEVQAFQAELETAIVASVKEAESGHSSYLKQFGRISVPELERQNLGLAEMLRQFMETAEVIKRAVAQRDAIGLRIASPGGTTALQNALSAIAANLGRDVVGELDDGSGPGLMGAVYNNRPPDQHQSSARRHAERLAAERISADRIAADRVTARKE